MDIQTIIMTIAIPFIVWALRKLSLPIKWAPIAAFAVAILLVSLGKVFGVEMDVATIADVIIKGLAMSGVAVLGYDTFRAITTPK